MSCEEVWEIVKELGAGGQGKVFEVVRKTEILGYESEIITSLISLTASSVDNEKRREHLRQFKNKFAKLLRADNPENHKALKVLHGPGEARDFNLARKRIEKEISIMAENLHPNLLKIFEYGKDYNWFVSQYYPIGSLDNYIEKYKGNLKAALTDIRPIVEAVGILHHKGYVHRDIKPHNIFIDNNNLILGDFGLVYFIDSQQTRISETIENVGSRDWMPGWAYGLRVEEVKPTFDVFSLGKVIWSMVSGKPILPLWYFDKENSNVELLFPQKSDMRLANELFRKCIVEFENNCLEDADALLAEIDKILRVLEVGADHLDINARRVCKVCGIGIYQIEVNEDIHGIEKFGLTPRGHMTMKIFECDYCGHVQIFSSRGKVPKAWQ